MKDRSPKILLAKDFQIALGEELRSTQGQALLISAYITYPALSWIKENVQHDLSITLIARWSYRDMVSGSSDFRSYWMARECGFRFFVDPTLHTKAYVFDRTRVFLGSANLTSRGLWLLGTGNEERITMVTPAVEDIESLESLVDQAVELNDELVNKMEQAVSSTTGSNTDDWPAEIRSQLEKPIIGLWVSDLLFCQPESLISGSCLSDDLKRDRSTLSASNSQLNHSCLQKLFIKTKVYAWVRALVRTEGNVRFGLLSAALHNVLLDSPTPYRREVKGFVRLLFAWIDFLQDDNIAIQKHQHTVSMQWVEKR